MTVVGDEHVRLPGGSRVYDLVASPGRPGLPWMQAISAQAAAA